MPAALSRMAIYLFYLVTASVHVHNIPSQKAWLVFGIIGVIFALIGVYAEYKARTWVRMEQWRQMGEDMRKEYQDQQDMEKSSDEMRSRPKKWLSNSRNRLKRLKDKPNKINNKSDCMLRVCLSCAEQA